MSPKHEQKRYTNLGTWFNIIMFSAMQLIDNCELLLESVSVVVDVFAQHADQQKIIQI